MILGIMNVTMGTSSQETDAVSSALLRSDINVTK